MADRTVHALYHGVEIVRYDRAGKWFLEYTDSRPRRRVTVEGAARHAIWGQRLGGRVFLNRPGGLAFDSKVRRAQSAAPPAAPSGELDKAPPAAPERTP